MNSVMMFNLLILYLQSYIFWDEVEDLPLFQSLPTLEYVHTFLVSSEMLTLGLGFLIFLFVHLDSVI